MCGLAFELPGSLTLYEFFLCFSGTCFYLERRTCRFFSGSGGSGCLDCFLFLVPYIRPAIYLFRVHCIGLQPKINTPSCPVAYPVECQRGPACKAKGAVSEIRAVLPELPAKGLGTVSGTPVQQFPETGTVVHLDGMAQFMEQDIFHQFFRQ